MYPVRQATSFLKFFQISHTFSVTFSTLKYFHIITFAFSTTALVIFGFLFAFLLVFNQSDLCRFVTVSPPIYLWSSSYVCLFDSTHFSLKPILFNWSATTLNQIKNLSLFIWSIKSASTDWKKEGFQKEKDQRQEKKCSYWKKSLFAEENKFKNRSRKGSIQLIRHSFLAPPPPPPPP